MIFKTSPCHKFINKQPLIILNAVSNKLNKIRMVKLSKKIYFSLQHSKSAMMLNYLLLIILPMLSSNINLLAQEEQIFTNHPFSMALKTIWL